MDFDMEQHEVVFNCAKRAIEQALFNYTLSPNEVYDAALTYTRDEEKRTASTAAIKNSYAKTLMKAMNYFCVEPFEKLNLNNLIAAPKIYDDIYQKNQWHTCFDVLKTIHVEPQEEDERKNLRFSEVLLYLTLLTNGGKINKAIRDPITSPYQKFRARKWLEDIGKGMFSFDMQKLFRNILLWLIEDELSRDFNNISYSLITEFGLSKEKIESVMKQKNDRKKSNLYRDFARADAKRKTFLDEYFEGETEQVTNANFQKYDAIQAKRYLYWNAMENILWVANLVACCIIPNNFSENEWQEDDVWFLQMLIDSPDYPAHLAEKLESELVEIRLAQQRTKNMLNSMLEDFEHKRYTSRKYKIYEYHDVGGHQVYVPTWLEYREACWLAEVIAACTEATTKEVCLMLSTLPRAQIYSTETLYDYLKGQA